MKHIPVRIGKILCIYTIGHNKKLYEVIQSVVGMLFVAHYLIDCLADINASPLQLNLNEWKTINEDCYIIAIDIFSNNGCLICNLKNILCVVGVEKREIHFNSLLHTLSRWILEKSSRSDSAMMTLPKIETLERIDQKYLAEHLDETLDRVRKENIALVITKDGKDDLVLCPQSWVSPMVDDEFGCVVNSAIRHALRSYDSDSSGVLHFVLKNYKLFDERTLAVAISDIERDLDYPLFPVSSSESWLEIKELQPEVHAVPKNAHRG